jgi:hypothetical protein
MEIGSDETKTHLSSALDLTVGKLFDNFRSSLFSIIISSNVRIAILLNKKYLNGMNDRFNFLKR